jgi:hypothetical protein
MTTNQPWPWPPDVPGGPLDQRAGCRLAVLADGQVAFPAAGHGPVVGLTQPPAPRPLIIPHRFRRRSKRPVQAQSKRAPTGPRCAGKAGPPGLSGVLRDTAAQAGQRPCPQPDLVGQRCNRHGHELVVAAVRKPRRQVNTQISRRAAAVGVAVLTGLAPLGAAGAAFASPAAPAIHNRVQVLRFHTVFVSVAVNHAGHGGPGDVTAAVFDVRALSGAEAGKAYISCTAATASEELCYTTFVLRGGQIDAQAAFAEPVARFTQAVTGGTGIYEGVTGQIRNVEPGPGVINRTFYLIRPGQG